MSVRVNLLPREVEQREAARRQRGLLVLAFVVVLAGLTALYMFQLSRVNDAEERLAEAEALRDAEQEKVEALAEYQQLEARQTASAAMLQETMTAEASLAGILQDVAAVMPSDAALTVLSVTIGVIDANPNAAGPAYGRLTGSADSLSRHAPGVERVLLDFDKVAAFFNPFLTSSVTETLPDGSEITVFNFEVDLGPEIYTGRYNDGLPPELR